MNRGERIEDLERRIAEWDNLRLGMAGKRRLMMQLSELRCHKPVQDYFKKLEEEKHRLK